VITSKIRKIPRSAPKDIPVKKVVLSRLKKPCIEKIRHKGKSIIYIIPSIVLPR
jgi:hypothetical protein